jgi:hypothetical protein
LNGDLEVSLGTLNLFNLGTGDQVDIKMPADLDQFRRDNSHGTIIGGEGLVQFAHDPTNGGRFFDQVDIVSGICQIEGRLQSGNSSAYNHNGSIGLLGGLCFHDLLLEKWNFSI